MRRSPPRWFYRAPLAGGDRCWFHTGLYNVFAMSCPTFGVTVVVAGVATPQPDPGWLQIAALSLEQTIARAARQRPYAQWA